MSLYSRLLAPRLVDMACGARALDRWRRSVVEDLTGVVLEVGIGGGRNLHLYPAAVTEVWGIEPSAVMRHRAETRARELGRTLRWVGEDAENVDIADGSVNALVSTFTACTIADPARVLSTLRPALRQGGELRCVEHGIAPDESVRRWQRRLEPLHIALADGCHLMRDPLGIVRDAGYDDTASSSRYLHRRQKWIYVTSLRAVPREV